MARIAPVSIPGTAWGSTTFHNVSNFVAPSAYAPSRMEMGTDESPSSVATTTTGTVSKAQGKRRPQNTTRSNVGVGMRF